MLSLWTSHGGRRMEATKAVVAFVGAGDMKTLWCWRCKMEIPMLDEEEYAQISALYSEGVRATKKSRQKFDLPLDRMPSMKERFRPMLDAYERLTGFREENPNAIMHHRIATYGQPCQRCGKALRTPKARKCFECGLVVAPMEHG